MNRFLRSLDPLVIFALLGGPLFGLHLLTRSPDPGTSERRIVVTDADVAWLIEAFQKRRLRPPTRQEVRGLVDRMIKDEVLYREAVALGLDREDPALRRRLAMKLEYLARDVGAAAEPTEAELQAHLDANPERYAMEPRRRFAHVYVSEDRRGTEAAAEARALLEALRANPEQDVTKLGDPILLEAEQPMASRADVERRFGREFVEGLFALEAGSWGGPVRSGFGLHLVRVHEAEAAEAPGLEDVRDRVRNDLLQQRKEAASENYIQALLEKYDVVVRSSLLAPDPASR